jgi:energy-coupling factor transporter transmembrane protein EcfT
MEQLYGLWTAPLAGYAPAFVAGTSAGYLVSAAIGVGAILAIGLVIAWPLSRRGRRRNTFIERTSAALAGALHESLFAEQVASSSGFLQSIDPRVKLAGIALLIGATVAAQRLWVITAILAVAVVLARLSQVPLRSLARAWAAVLTFTGVIALPAAFLIPRSAAFLILRAETTATLSLLLVLTTRWPHVLKALRSFRIPVIVVVMLGMTYRYIFLLLETARQISESREARQVGVLAASDRRRLAAASVGVLLEKTMAMSSDIHLAMQARGFRGEAHILEQWKMRRNDWLPLGAFAVLACLAMWVGR